MAITKCRECKGEISTDAASCPHCGAPASKAIVKPGPNDVTKSQIVGVIVICLAGVAWFASRGDDKPTAVATPVPPLAAVVAEAPVPTPKLKPEMLISFKDGNWVCASKDALGELMEHSMKQETTKAMAMTVQRGGSCFFMGDKKIVRIIAVEYNDPNMPLGLVEIVGANNTSDKGAWAVAVDDQVIIH